MAIYLSQNLYDRAVSEYLARFEPFVDGFDECTAKRSLGLKFDVWCANLLGDAEAEPAQNAGHLLRRDERGLRLDLDRLLSGAPFGETWPEPTA